MQIVALLLLAGFLCAYWGQVLAVIFAISAVSFVAWRLKKADAAADAARRAAEVTRREQMIAAGKAFRAVKIASSRRGGCYHSLHCGICRSDLFIDIADARRLAYVPCSTCGGEPVYIEGRKALDGRLVSA